MFSKTDKWLLFAVILLLLFGVWMMSWVSVFNSSEKEHNSATISYCVKQIPHYATLSDEKQKSAMRICKRTDKAKEWADVYCSLNNCNDRFFLLHIRNVFIALFGLVIAFLFPISFWRRIAPLAFIIGFILLVVVLILPAQGGFTAKSWLSIPVFGLFQPSEAMKLALALYGALWMEKKKKEVSTFASGFFPYLLLVGFVVFPVMLQPDFGSTLILIIIASAMFWVAGGHILHFIYSAGILSFIGFIAYSSFEYIQKRVDTFLNPELASAEDIYQIEQAHLSLGNGGIFGASDSTESFGFLPEIQGDMIFAAIGEKIGFFGMILIIGLYLFITLRGIRIAARAPDRFSMLIAIGIISWFASQTLINMMVVTGLFPLTGITLPLLSYGGTSMLITLFAMGILLRISTANGPQSVYKKRRNKQRFLSRYHRR